MNKVPAPLLVEPNTRRFYWNLLQTTHQRQVQWRNTMWNAGLCLVGLTFIACFLYLSYRSNKRTPEEEQERNQKNIEMVLRQIQRVEEQRKERENQMMITGMPLWDNEFDQLYVPSSALKAMLSEK